MKKRMIIVAVVLILNCIAIGASVKSGLDDYDIMLRFRERQAMTFLSALMLGLIAMISLVMYLLQKRIPSSNKGFIFWLLSSISFFYFTIDEYFMVHEGMDEMVGFLLFGKDIKHLNLDGLVIGFFGLVALLVCFHFKKELLKHKHALPFFIYGGVCLFGTVAFHFVERIDMTYEVIEESFKIVGVSFFLAAFLHILTSFIKKLSIAENR